MTLGCARCHMRLLRLVSGGKRNERSSHEGLRRRRHRGARQSARPAARGPRSRGGRHDQERIEAGPGAQPGSAPGRGRRAGRRRGRPGSGGRRAGGHRASAHRVVGTDERPRGAAARPLLRGDHDQPAAHRGDGPSPGRRPRRRGTARRRAELRRVPVRPHGRAGADRGRPARSHRPAGGAAQRSRRDTCISNGR